MLGFFLVRAAHHPLQRGVDGRYFLTILPVVKRISYTDVGSLFQGGTLQLGSPEILPQKLRLLDGKYRERFVDRGVETFTCAVC